MFGAKEVVLPFLEYFNNYYEFFVGYTVVNFRSTELL